MAILLWSPLHNIVWNNCNEVYLKVRRSVVKVRMNANEWSQRRIKGGDTGAWAPHIWGAPTFWSILFKNPINTKLLTFLFKVIFCTTYLSIDNIWAALKNVNEHKRGKIVRKPNSQDKYQSFSRALNLLTTRARRANRAVKNLKKLTQVIHHWHHCHQHRKRRNQELVKDA